jgi:hypothetical protein
MENRATGWVDGFPPAVLLAISASWCPGGGQRSLKPDTSTNLQDLHNTWSFGSSFKDALFSGLASNRIALARVTVSLIPINGSLCQRASTIIPRVLTQAVNFSIPIAQAFLDGYSRVITAQMDSASVLKPDFRSIVNDYNDDPPEDLTESSCNGRCTRLLQAAGTALFAARTLWHSISAR